MKRRTPKHNNALQTNNLCHHFSILQFISRFFRQKQDRLSDLPDSVLLHILSFLDIKQAIQTCIFSTRWKNLWKNLQTLRLTSSTFTTLEGFTIFMSQILPQFYPNTLHTLLLHRNGSRMMEPHLVKKILKYAVSHNVQLLDIDVLCDIQIFPSCLFSCHTLTSLVLYVVQPITYKRILFPDSLDFPALTTLHLGNVAFCGGKDHFSAYPKLKRLILSFTEIFGEENLRISSTTLVELTIGAYYKSLNYSQIELFTPNICTFAFIATPFQILCVSHLSSVKLKEIFVTMFWNVSEAHSVLLSRLLEFADIQSLTDCYTTLQVLSLLPDLLKVKLHSLLNLKSLTVESTQFSYELMESLIDAKIAQLPNISQEVTNLGDAYKKGSSSAPYGIVDLLLQNSPSTEVRIVY